MEVLMVRQVSLAVSVCLLIAAASAPSTYAETPHASHVESGTTFDMTPQQPIRSAGNVRYAGSTVDSAHFKVVNDVRSRSGELLIEQHEDVRVEIRTQQARRVGRQGWIEVIPLSTFDAEENPVSLVRRGIRVDGQRRLGAAIGVGVVTFGLGLLIKGRDTSIEPGHELTVLVE